MKILIAVAHPAPLFAAEQAGRPTPGRLPALAVELQRAGHEVSVVAPLGAPLAQAAALLGKPRPTGVVLGAPLGNQPRVSAEVLEARSPHGLQVFLLRQPEHFERPAAAGSAGPATGAPAASAPAPAPAATETPGATLARPAGAAKTTKKGVAARGGVGPAAAPPALPGLPPELGAGALFAKLTAELARRLNPAPDVVQAHDWAGALALVFLRAQRMPFATVLALGDLAAQGSFPLEDFGLLNLGWEWFTPAGIEFYGRINCLKGGLLTADALVADGESERRALQHPAYGHGLDAVLRENAGRLHGIPDGLDEVTWNPATDRLIPRKFTPLALAGKRHCTNALLTGLGLAKNPAGPVYLVVRSAAVEGDKAAALAAPEALGWLTDSLDQVLADDARLVVVGGRAQGSLDEVPLRLGAKRYPAKMTWIQEPLAALDPARRHGLLAAADFLVGLDLGRDAGATILRAMRYGAVPILPAGVGFEQIVDDYQPGGEIEGGHGLYFYELSRAALLDTLFGRARPLVTEQPARLEGLRQRAMLRSANFNWSRTAADYVNLYGRLRTKT